MTLFTKTIYEIVAKIPKGSTMSYGEVARMAGHPTAARAVASILHANKDLNIPCHRVIRSDGGIGGYNGLRGNKEDLLRQELNGPLP